MKDGRTTLRVNGDGTLLPFLLEKMGMSRTSLKSLLAHDCVLVNDRAERRFDRALKAGDVVSVLKNAPRQATFSHPKLRLVYEDDYLLVVDKREGLLTVATTPESRETTVFSILKSYVRANNPRQGVFVVHRLDRETSGLLVFAKNADIQKFMRENWRTIVQNRAYMALVEGELEKDEDTIVSWLTENPKTTRVRSSWHDDGGKKSITHYRKRGSNGRCSLVELHLETGRTNQIRVQMAAIGHPVLGDRKYGSGSTPIIDRLALHASTLEFTHPVTQKLMRFESKCPFSQLGMRSFLIDN
jgi:23S rRNA pseudouridine1911/1915/1917 synthase